MADNLNYQKAKRIRNTGFTDLLADQLATAPTIRGAIGKTISMKTRASIKGIKEKFDPLNIAKFLTGGSSLGPALLGRLLGRSEKDIEYFSGRMRPIRERGTATKIGKEPGTGGNAGLNEMLRKIYYLMQITRESDLQRRDVEINYDEERKIEAEKRHRELLKALSGLNVQTAEIVDRGDQRSLFDMIADFLKKRRLPVLPVPSSRVPRLPLPSTKELGTYLRSAAGFLLNPVVLGVAGVAATAWLLKHLYENDTPEGEPTAAGEGKTIPQLAAEVGPEGPPIERPNVTEVADEKKVQNRMADLRLRMRNMKMVGADDNRMKIYLRDYAESKDPVDREAATRLLSEIKPQKMTAADFQRLDKDTTPVPVPSTPELSNRLASATTENIDSNLPTVVPPAPRTAPKNIVVPAQNANQQEKLVDLKTIAVRNVEPTFMKMIMDSTRVV